MRKIVLIGIAIALAAGAASGQAKKGQFGMQTAVTFVFVPDSSGANGVDLGAVYMISDVLAVRMAGGFLNTSSGGTSTLGYDLGAGAEYHFPGKGGVSPYVGGQLSYSGASVPSGSPKESGFGINAVLGADYFFSPNFSWGADMMIGYQSITAGGATTTTFGTNAFTMKVTWYLN